jgi:hypoxanthine phosphoribosyltransferase
MKTLTKTTAKTIKDTESFTFGELNRFAKELANIYSNPLTKLSSYSPDLIIGINRGGLVPATLLSYKMNVPLGIISIQTYDDNRETSTLKINTNICTTLDLSKVGAALIVDDIADSGETLGIAIAEMRKKIPCITTATIHYKEKSIVKPDYYYKKIKNSTWIKYAWAED